MEAMTVTVDMGMGMVVVIIITMDMVTMVITKRPFLLSSEVLKIVQEKVLLPSVFGT
jgi:hypothetical protein